VLGVYTSLLMTFTRPSRRPTVNGEVWLDFHEVSNFNVSGVLQNRVCIVDAVFGLSEQGVDAAVRIICVSI